MLEDSANHLSTLAFPAGLGLTSTGDGSQLPRRLLHLGGEMSRHAPAGTRLLLLPHVAAVVLL